jgi:hypothetical protein
VLHRDIKPSNVLLEFTSGDPQQTGGSESKETYPTVSLSDFGLARLEADTAELTRTGAVMGTPAYMAPEQAEARLRDVSARTDIWALGAVLYELLIGKPPFQGESELQIRQQVVNEDPVSIRTLRPEVSRDLAAICQKCLEKKSQRRYETAAELAHDLERFLDRRPTEARPLTRIESSLRWVRKHPQWTGMAAALLVAAVMLVAGLAFHSARLTVLTGQLHALNADLEIALADARSAQRRAEASDRKSQQLLYIQDIRLADEAWRGNDLHGSLKAWALPAGTETAAVPAHDGPIRNLDVADSESTMVSCGDDAVIRAWKLPSLERLGELQGHEKTITGVAISPAGQRVASASHDETTRVWKLDDAAEVWAQAHRFFGFSLVCRSPDGSRRAATVFQNTFLEIVQFFS